MESDFEFEYQMSLRLVHKLLSKVEETQYQKQNIILLFPNPILVGFLVLGALRPSGEP